MKAMRASLFTALLFGLCGCVQTVDSTAESNRTPPLSEIRGDDESLWSSLPSFQQGKYRVDAYIAVAIRLQDIGREDACQQLLEEAKTGERGGSSYAGQKVAALSRMLFKPREGVEFRRPYLGGASFFGGTDYSDWPLEPIELVDGVPFLITRGYMVAGSPESASSYLEYCVSECDWNSYRFHESTSEEKENALRKILNSEKWKRPLDQNEEDFFAAQIK